MRKLLKISLFLLPIFFIPISINGIEIDIRNARELLFQSLVIVGLGIAIGNIWLKWFLVWATLSWWFNFFLPPQSTVVFFNIVFGLLFFYFIKTFIKKEEIEKILKLICITALVQIGWLVVQLFKKDFIFYCYDSGSLWSGVGGLFGFMGNRAVLGTYLALCLPLFRVYFKWFIPLIIVGLIISRSSIAVISGISGLICFETITVILNKDYKKIIWLIIFCLIFCGLFFYYIDRLGLERISLWKRILTQMKWEQHLGGQGMGRFQNLRIIIDKTNSVWDNPHNEYLNIYFELGAMALFLVIGYIVNLIRRFIKIFKTKEAIVLFSGIIVLLINSMGMFPMQLACTAFLGIIYFGLLEVILCQSPRVISLKN